MMGIVEEPVPEPIQTTKLLVNFNEDNKQDHKKIPEKFAPVHPSGLWRKLTSWQLKKHFGTTPFSLVYYVKTDRLQRLDLLFFTPWICGFLFAWILPLAGLAQVFLLSGDCINAKHSETNTSSEFHNNSSAGLIPLPPHDMLLVFVLNFNVLFLFSLVYFPIWQAIRRNKPYFNALKRLIFALQGKYSHWVFRVLAFLAMAGVTCMTCYWAEQADTASSAVECLSGIAIEFQTMGMYVYAAGATGSIVLPPTIIFPSCQSLKEFEQALQQRSKMRQMASMNV